MYEYKFVKIAMSKFGIVSPKEDYHRIIDEHASRGWRLVQLYSPPIGIYGVATFVEIVFEKKQKTPTVSQQHVRQPFD